MDLCILLWMLPERGTGNSNKFVFRDRILTENAIQWISVEKDHLEEVFSYGTY